MKLRIDTNALESEQLLIFDVQLNVNGTREDETLGFIAQESLGHTTKDDSQKTKQVITHRPAS